MQRKRETIGAMARMWFAVTPQERALLFGILAVALLGLTARYADQRARAPIEVAPPEGEPAYEEEDLLP